MYTLLCFFFNTVTVLFQFTHHKIYTMSHSIIELYYSYNIRWRTGVKKDQTENTNTFKFFVFVWDPYYSGLGSPFNWQQSRFSD